MWALWSLDERGLVKILMFIMLVLMATHLREIVKFLLPAATGKRLIMVVAWEGWWWGRMELDSGKEGHRRPPHPHPREGFSRSICILNIFHTCSGFRI